MKVDKAVVGIVPAAGLGTRMASYEGSKEIYPIGGEGPRHVEKAVCEYLLEYFAAAGIKRAIVVRRPGKDDIPAHLDAIDNLTPSIDHVVIEGSRSVPETVDAAFHQVSDCRVALGFPDILLRPATAFRDLLARQQATSADVVLGLFPTDQDARSDMVETDLKGRAVQIVIKQPACGLTYTWSIAVWTPTFGAYLHSRLAAKGPTPLDEQELHLGDIVQSAIDDGLHVDTVAFADGRVIDIGTPEGLRDAIDNLHLYQTPDSFS